MVDRVILDRISRNADHPVLLGMVGSEPVLVELDNGACMKLGGWISPEDTAPFVDRNIENLADAVERLYDDQAFEKPEDPFGTPTILVTALDID